eukprot:1287290-Pyramimonas_sp.AAC.1
MRTPHHPCQTTIPNVHCLHMWSTRGQPDAPPSSSLSKTVWGKVLSHAREARGHCILFLTRGGGGVSICPAVRRATMPDAKNNANCTSRLNLDHAWPPRDHCQVVFDWGGGRAR